MRGTCSARATSPTGNGSTAQGLSFIDLMIEQATTPGNKSYQVLAEVIEKDAEKKQAEKEADEAKQQAKETL